MTDYSRDQLREIDTDIERIYYAARHGVPAASQLVAGAANALHQWLEVVDAQAAHAGDPTFLASMLQAGRIVHDELRVGVIQLDHFATALEATGDDFVATDDRARQDFEGRWRELDAMEGRADSRTGTPPPAFDTPVEAPGADHDPSVYGPYGPGGPPPVTSAPDPEAPSTDAEERSTNESNSRREHGIEQRRG